jgi:hypothetical protein
VSVAGILLESAVCWTMIVMDGGNNETEHDFFLHKSIGNFIYFLFYTDCKNESNLTIALWNNSNA